jgi:hypothetical protein
LVASEAIRYDDADLLDGRESAFTETHFFRAAEFESLLADAGLTVQSLAGLEGLASVYSGIEAKANPFTGMDEADNWEPIYVIAPSRSFIFDRNIGMTTPRRFRRPSKRILSGFGPHHV